jgi:hypothetical protein
MGGQPKSSACGDRSSAVRLSAQESSEAAAQKQRDAAGILFALERGGCQINRFRCQTRNRRADGATNIVILRPAR